MLENNQILLVMDNEESAKYLREYLIIRGGYSVSVVQAVSQALEVFKQSACKSSVNTVTDRKLLGNR